LKRIPIGGFHATDLMLKLMQLKYPLHRNVMTVENIQQLKENHTIVSNNYLEEIRKLSKDREHFNKNTIVIQLPYVLKLRLNITGNRGRKENV
jgi:actin-related protein